MKAQMRKNMPGGVTQRWQASETLPVLRPMMQLTATAAAKRRKLPMRMGQAHFPYTPRGLLSAQLSGMMGSLFSLKYISIQYLYIFFLSAIRKRSKYQKQSYLSNKGRYCIQDQQLSKDYYEYSSSSLSLQLYSSERLSSLTRPTLKRIFISRGTLSLPPSSFVSSYSVISSSDSLDSSSSCISMISQFFICEPLIYTCTTSLISNSGNLLSCLVNLSLALLNTSRAPTFSFKKLMEGWVLSLWTPILENWRQHFSSSSSLPKMMKMVEKDQMRFLEKQWGETRDLTSDSALGMILLASRTAVTLWKRCCMRRQACFFYLCRAFSEQQLGIMLGLSVKRMGSLVASSTSTSSSLSKSRDWREDSLERGCVWWAR